jgi:acetolactate synthase-1/2/3 large subunit
VVLAQSFGISATLSTLDSVGADLAEALRTPGPSVVVLPALLKMFEPTHLEKS